MDLYHGAKYAANTLALPARAHTHLLFETGANCVKLVHTPVHIPVRVWILQRVNTFCHHLHEPTSVWHLINACTSSLHSSVCKCGDGSVLLIR
jgi:hypothetical protein